MDQEQRFHDLLVRVLELPTEERQPFLQRMTAEDPDLLREVRQLLDVEEDLSELRLVTEVVEDALGSGAESRPATAVEDVRVPERVGRYRIEARLGRGGMGEVYRGFDEHLERPVALKHVMTDLEDSPVALERLRREAKSIARLSHRAIVQIFDWVEEDDGCWYVMELVEGQTLKRVIDGQPLSVDRGDHDGLCGRRGAGGCP